MNPWCKAAGDLAADCRHAPEAHDGDHGRPLWRHDARRCHDGGVPAPGGLGMRNTMVNNDVLLTKNNCVRAAMI